MPYCPRCGVELDASVRQCPLCSTPIPTFPDLGPGEPAWPETEIQRASDPSQTYASPGERRARAFLSLAAVFATAALAVTAADLFITGAITWSRYPLVCLTAAFGLVASVLIWHQRPRVWAFSWFAVTVGLLGCLDQADGRLDWFPTLGLPLAVSGFAVVGAGWAGIRRLRRRGYNLFGLVLTLAAVELLSIDGLVTAWTSGHLGWGWSLVACLGLVPLAFLFFFLHFALHRTPDLRRTFHF